ncbi:MAG: hypothetical protein ACOX63_10210 [Christensenellales bacterium]|jgi:hypothetical protein
MIRRTIARVRRWNDRRKADVRRLTQYEFDLYISNRNWRARVYGR